jgi:hypothetical protein
MRQAVGLSGGFHGDRLLGLLRLGLLAFPLARPPDARFEREARKHVIAEAILTGIYER